MSNIETNLVMFQTTSGSRFLFDGHLELCGSGPWKIDPTRLYVFDQVISPQGEVVSRPTRLDNTPFCPKGDVVFNTIEAWWEISEKSDLYQKFQELKKVQSAKKAGLVLA